MKLERGEDDAQPVSQWAAFRALAILFALIMLISFCGVLTFKSAQAVLEHVQAPVSEP